MHKNDLSPLKATYLSDNPVPIMVFSQYQKSTRACASTHGQGRETDNAWPYSHAGVHGAQQRWVIVQGCFNQR